MKAPLRRHLEEAAGIAVVLTIAGVFIWLGKVHAEVPTSHDAVEYANISCKVVPGKKDCLSKLNQLGAAGWQLGGATFDNSLDETTFWLQRKK